MSSPKKEAVAIKKEAIAINTEMKSADVEAVKPDAEAVKPDAEAVKPDVETTKPNAETEKLDAEMTPANTEVKHENIQQNVNSDEVNSKPIEDVVNPDTEMTVTPKSPLEQHEATVSAIRGALFSDLPPEQAAEQALQATSSHPDRDKILSSTLHTALLEVPFEDALRLIDVSTHLPYAARHTISLIEALTKSLTTSTLSKSLPLLQPRIDTIHTRPFTDIALIRLLRSFISRDPHAANPVLAGRLKLLIAAALPVWHPSGMNKRGKYNTHVLPPVPTPADPALARALTAFTDGCRYPPGCEQAAGWSSAKDGLKVLLDAFDVGNFLEIQRRICVQAAILFQHLEFDGGSFGKSLFVGGEGAVLRRRIWDRLDGGFKRFALLLLQRERRWVRWKKTMEHAQVPKVEIGKVFKRRVVRKHYGRSLGTEKMGLTKPSWKTLRERTCGGGVKTLIEELKEDQKEAEEDRRKGDGKYVWRGLRCLCEENVRLMAKVADSEGKVDLERILLEEG